MFLALLMLFLCLMSKVALGGPLHDTPVWGKIHTKNSEKSSSISNYIVGGVQANQGDIPWHALIIPDATNLCGASLISNQWIMTAGHCVYWHLQFTVYLGRTDRLNAQAGSLVLTVKTKVVYPAYKGKENQAHLDLALLKFDALVDTKSNAFIKPIRLVGKANSKSTFVGTNVYVSGFGKTSDDPQPSDLLMWTNNTIVSNAVCRKTYGAKIKAEIICMSGMGPRSICHGDSGGALTYKEADGIYTQIGTVSFVTPSCIRGNPQGFVRTGYYLNWIVATTGIPIRP